MRRLFGAKAAATLTTVVAAIAAAGCGPDRASDAVPIEDLSRDLVRAERRAAGDPDAAIRMDIAGPPDDRRLSLVADAPARITWSRRLPARARIATAVWLAGGTGATARVGIADDRTYEVLGQVELTAPASWRPFTIDLGGYGGWQWSLFYRPAGRTWRLVFSVDATPGGTIAWDAPRIEARR